MIKVMNKVMIKVMIMTLIMTLIMMKNTPVLGRVRPPPFFFQGKRRPLITKPCVRLVGASGVFAGEQTSLDN